MQEVVLDTMYGCVDWRGSWTKEQWCVFLSALSSFARSPSRALTRSRPRTLSIKRAITLVLALARTSSV